MQESSSEWLRHLSLTVLLPCAHQSHPGPHLSLILTCGIGTSLGTFDEQRTIHKAFVNKEPLSLPIATPSCAAACLVDFKAAASFLSTNLVAHLSPSMGENRRLGGFASSQTEVVVHQVINRSVNLRLNTSITHLSAAPSSPRHHILPQTL